MAAGLLAVLALASGAAAGSSGTLRLLASAEACPGADDPAASRAVQVRAMGCLVNYARSRQGLKPLRVDDRLVRAAALKLADNERCDQFSHTPCGEQFLSVFQRAGYVARGVSFTVGENIAWGQGTLGSPRRIMAAWLNSPGHRQNILSPRWRDFGISLRPAATFTGRRNVVLWANTFGRRAA